MDLRFKKLAAIPLCTTLVFGVAQMGTAADAPTPSAALKLSPIQPLVEYTIPNNEETAQCTIRPEKENNITSWVVRNKQGEVLRRFSDSNNDNVVDQWCYFLGGLEVYRDIDSNFNGKADEYRWFNTAGTRWGTDKNEDGKIDTWRTISPHEVAEQVVLALKARDPARFQLLLVTPDELKSLGFGQARAESVATSAKTAPADFSKFLAEQKAVTAESRFLDFGSAKPATIPAGTAGSTKDVIVSDNSAALVQTGGKHDQVYLGTLVSIGDTWKLIGCPTDNQPQVGAFLAATPQQQSGGGGDNSPSEEMQKQLQILEDLDKKGDGNTPEEIAAGIEQRAAALTQLAKIAPEADRDQWYRQLIDTLSIAIQSGSYPKGAEQLNQLQKSLEEAKADEDLIAHAVYQRMWAEFLTNQRDPNANAGELQSKWLTDLAAFVAAHPKSADTAEALYQLGMNLEFVLKPEEAAKWYQQLATNFPTANPAKKANGALRRLGSVGKPIALRGDAQGGAVDISSPQYRGKVVLVHYWTTLGDRWKDDMVLLKDFYTKKGPREFDIIGVCLDDSPEAAKQYVAQNKLPWKQIYENLDGRLATEMGVITLPLMVLVDQKGNVVNPNVHVAELDTELAKLAKPAAGAANALRGPAPLR
jgi:hypothetical protein